MADNTTSQKSGAESPTTARPIEFDDEQQETGVIQSDGTTQTAPPPQSSASQPKGVRFEDTLAQEEETPPTKPPRPMSPQQQAEHTLIEAFPTVDAKVVKAVLSASGGQIEPAFNALLEMSDPEYQQDAPPPRPPRLTAEQRQMEQDEMYARQLQQQYGGSGTTGYAPRTSSLPQGRQPPAQEDREHSFFEDELPQIGENLRQEFFRTQNRLSNWISDFRKKIDGDEDEDHGGGRPAMAPGTAGPMQSDYQPYSPDGNRNRRSTDRERYDDDPHVLSSNFTELELRDDEGVPPQKPPRPQANPNLFKPSPVAPQSGPVDEVDAAYGRPTPVERQASPPTAGGKSNKWQPLTSVAPNPEADDNDPFSLGDSDEEGESKTKDIRAEDTARLKSMAEASQEQTVEPASDKTLEPAERSGSLGTRNKEMEDLLNK